MRTNFVLIDLENVRPENLGLLTGGQFKVKIFAGSQQKNVSIDMAHGNQDLLGHRTLNLLNSHEDPSFLHTVLSLQIAREYMAAPKANFVRVVINGENWGVYTSAEQVNKDFVKEWFGNSKVY